MKQLILACSVLCLLFLSSCNTVEGVGKDVESVGSTIKDTARDSK